MNYQAVLLKRKGQFGIVWLAAHHPSKLSKSEILHLNLDEKCKEIKEYLVNGKSNKPKFSLLISSHLMLGLVVLLNKKNNYLYEDLKILNTELHASYLSLFRREIEISVTDKQKTPRKKAKPAEKHIITIKENLPAILDLSNIESIVEYENQRIDEALRQVRQGQNITMDEFADDFTHNLIQVDYDYRLDSFDNVIDLTTRADMSESVRIRELEKGTSTFIDLFDRDYLENTVVQTKIHKQSTATKPARQPFKELDKNVIQMQTLSESTIMEADSTSITDLEHRLQAAELTAGVGGLSIESGLMPVVPPEINIIPDLYGETILMEPEEKSEAYLKEVEARELMPPPPPPQPDQTGKRQRPISRSISAEIQELEAKRARKLELAQRVAQRRHALIIDTNTQLTTTEITRNMLISVSGPAGPPVVGRFDEQEEEDVSVETDNLEERRKNLDNLFRKRTGWVHTKYDFLKLDLLNQPSCQLMKQTTRIFSKGDLNSYIKTRYLRANMKTTKIPDDHYYYTTGKEEEVAAEISVEAQRERGSRLSLDEAAVTSTRKKRTQLLKDSSPSRISEHFLQPPIIQIEDVSAREQQQITVMESFEQPYLEIPQQPQFAESIGPHISTTTAQLEPEKEDEYENLLIDKLNQTEDQTLILQDVIKTAELPDRLLQSRRPRRLYAAKLFSATLKLAARQTIDVEQEKMYDDIFMRLI